jgi:hypothetical protein
LKFTLKCFFISAFILFTVISFQTVKGDVGEPSDNYLLLKVYPDESISLSSKGNYSGVSTSFEDSPLIKSVILSIDITSLQENVTDLKSRLFMQLNSLGYTPLSDMVLNIAGSGDSSLSNLTIYLNYPEHIELNGTIGIVTLKPPNVARVDMTVQTKLYFSDFSKEDVEMLAGFLPLLKSEIMDEIVKETGGYLALGELSLMNYYEASDHAVLTLSVSLSGDFQKGIKYLLSSMGENVDVSDYLIDGSQLSLGSYDFNVKFTGSSMALEAQMIGRVYGDFDRYVNEEKNTALQSFIDQGYLGEEDLKLVSGGLSIDLGFHDFSLDVNTTLAGNSVRSAFSLVGLDVKPSSYTSLLNYLETISNSGQLDNYQLVIEGESKGEKYVAIDVPSETKRPVTVEESRVIWDMSELKNLDEVTYSVETTQQPQNTTIITLSVVGLIMLVTIIYLYNKRKLESVISP